MMSRRFVKVALLLGTVATLLWAQEAPTVTAGALEKLAAEVKTARAGALKNAIDKLEKAAATPKAAQDFFLECVKKFDFKQDLDEPLKFEQWKPAFLAQWKGHDLGVVLQLQLRHQALVLRSAGAEDKAALIPSWLAFVDFIVKNAREAAYGVSFLAQPVNSSVFDKALKLHHLAGANAFAVSTIDIGGIFDQHIHPHAEPERRAALWRQRIEAQKQFAEVAMLQSEREDFANFEIPRLQWRALLDVHFHDGKRDDAAMSEAVRFIRQNLLHPDAAMWVALIKRVGDTTAAKSP